MSEPLLVVDDLHVSFPMRRTVGGPRRELQAVAGVSFAVATGTTLGLVGESGSGKSTTARAIVGLESIKSGDVRFDGRSLRSLTRADWREVRRDIQMVFQDPYASLHPRMTAIQTISEGWRAHSGIVQKRRWRTEALDLMERVGLNPDHADRLPNQFSGGQRQRIGIARALAMSPRLLVLDEPVSALDVSIQAQILNLLADLQADLGLTCLFIAHDLAVVQHVSHHVAVMYLGRIAEHGGRKAIYEHPAHPYTRALLEAVPQLQPTPDARPEGKVLGGDIPSPADPPSGCRFRTRCPWAVDACAEVEPRLVGHGTGHEVACIRVEEVTASA